MTEDVKKLLIQSNYVRKEITNIKEDDSYYRWNNKEVKNSETIFIPSLKTLNNVTEPNNACLSINDEIKKDNISSLEIKTDTSKYQMKYTCGITVNVNKIKVNKFNRVSIWMYIKAVGFQNFYFHFKLGNNGEVHTASVEINKWTRVMWELEDVSDQEIDKVVITPFIFGTPPEGLSEISFYINKIDLEQVEADYSLGWDLDNRIAYCHSGYFVNEAKTAILQNVKDEYFYVIDENNNEVFKNKVSLVDKNIGIFNILDFSKFNKVGKFKLKVDNIETPLFDINENPYLSSIVKSINFLRLLRCGEDIEGVHSACHLNCKSEHENKSTVPNFGGWHDAGDLSQFEICTAEMANALLDLSFKIDDELLKERILEEAKVGISWLLRTRFSDGSRALAVSYSAWRDNELDPNDEGIKVSKAEKGPFESFCSASALAVAARCYKDEAYSNWCLRMAKEDFEYARKWYKEGIYTKRWGKNIDSQVCGQGLIAASELYLLTKDKHYIDVAIEYSQIIMKCQETSFSIGKSIRGFFYEDVDHKYILTYEHRGHEQSPVHGLCRILQVYPEIENKEDIIDCITMYGSYIMNTISMTDPYYLLPGHIYNIHKINPERFTIPSYMCTKEEGFMQLIEQIKSGIKINDEWYLRIFPIAVQRRGFHATLLSKAKAVSMIATTLNDKELKKIAIKQLEWILGANPFASSTMYGEGHNYHPLYVAFSRQMVGALPVGIMTKGLLDLPYWPTFNNAVFKEIWGHTTGKYLWVLADLL